MATTVFNFVQAQPFTLAGSGVSAGATSIVLSSFTRIDGTLLTMSNFGDKGYGTLAPGNGTAETSISFTGVTQNSNGTATLTGVSDVLTVKPYTETSGVAQTYAGGTTFVISNTAGFYNALTAEGNDETVTGTWTFPSNEANRARISTDTDTAIPAAFVSFGQLSRQAISGAANASTLVKGIVQLATGTQAQAGTTLGSTGAVLVPPNSLFNSTTSANIIIPVTNTNGKLSSGFGGSADSLAQLGSTGLVVQNPESASRVANFNTIPISGTSSSVLADGFQTVKATEAAVLVGGSNVNAGLLHTHSNLMKKIHIVTTPVAVSSSTAETTLASYTIEGGTLSTNNGVRVRIKMSAISITASRALTFRFKYGATTLITSTNTNGTGGTLTPATGMIEFVLIATGATNSQAGIATALLTNAGFVADIGTNNSPFIFINDTGTSAQDSTTSLAVAVTAQLSNSSAGDTFTMDYATFERLS